LATYAALTGAITPATKDLPLYTLLYVASVLMTEPLRKSATLLDGNTSYLEWEIKGPALHFAHANGFNAQTYRGLLQPLAAQAHIFASDLRGHGQSTLNADTSLIRGWSVFRDDLVRLLDVLGAGPYVLAGHSMGATASVMVAATRPDLVRALVLCEPVFVPPTMWAMSRLMRAAGMTQKFDLAVRAAKRRDVFPSLDAAIAAYRGRGAFASWPEQTIHDYLSGGTTPTGNGEEVRLSCAPKWEAADFRNAPTGKRALAKYIRCPVTIIRGLKPGSTTSESEAGKFARAHGNTRIVTVAESGHFLPMEKPQIVRDEIARVLDAL
jgi:pimeloyl-ACP methyl ester carboxylesterase